jgi:hypothetical protein
MAAALEERGHLPDLSSEEILAWADGYHARTGKWPTSRAGPIPESPGETWLTVEAALYLGLRGLAARSTILRFLAKHWVRPDHLRVDLTVTQVLTWADAWYQRTGQRPNTNSGKLPGASGITWKIVDDALRNGRSDRPAGLTLRRLLLATRGLYRHQHQPPLTEDQILAWADAHHRRTNSWPKSDSGWIAKAPGESWNRIDEALRRGLRGLPPGSSLPRLLAERRGVRNRNYPPLLTVEQIVAWADAFHDRTGRWPTVASGPIAQAPEETWKTVHSALHQGLRGLPGGSSLVKLLAHERGIRNQKDLPPFTIPEILLWADAHRDRHGTWPGRDSGPIPEAPGETWLYVHQALCRGQRGLPGRSSLARLLAAERGARNVQALPPLTEDQILAWADFHHASFGRWPTTTSGPIADAPGENWQGVQNSLRLGRRGLPGGSTLARLLAREGRGRSLGLAINRPAEANIVITTE